MSRTLISGSHGRGPSSLLVGDRMSSEHELSPATREAQIDHAVFYCLARCAETNAPYMALATVITQLRKTGLWSEVDLRCVRDRVVMGLTEKSGTTRDIPSGRGR